MKLSIAAVVVVASVAVVPRAGERRDDDADAKRECAPAAPLGLTADETAWQSCTTGAEKPLAEQTRNANLFITCRHGAFVSSCHPRCAP